MNPKNYLEVLRTLIDLAVEYSFRHEVGSKGTQGYEPAFFAVLMYIKCAPLDLQKLAESEFINRLYTSGKSHELIGYCMRELKFPSVKEAVKQLHDSIENKGRDFQHRRTLEKILAVYEVEWRGDAAYTYHSRKHG